MRIIWKLIATIAIVGVLAACEKLPTDFSNGCEAVDLGLSVKWASYNVGARNADDSGSFFAWGETTEKSSYDGSKAGDYKWGIFEYIPTLKIIITKYTSDCPGGDGLKTLQPEDDPATVNWGTKWRTPTLGEIKELLDETKCEWTWDAAKKGYTVKGLKTGNSIFLPAAGRRFGSDLKDAGTIGYYWSSSVCEEDPPYASAFIFTQFNPERGMGIRYDGKPVRAVTE